MSFSISGTISQTTLLRALASEELTKAYIQECRHRAYLAGLAYLNNETGYHTPVDTGNLIGTAGGGVNQYSVWFSIAGTLTDPFDGKQKPYGAAQEFGWHDRAGGWHPGWHMVEEAATVASLAFIEFASGEGMAILRDAKLERYANTGNGDFGFLRGASL